MIALLATASFAACVNEEAQPSVMTDDTIATAAKRQVGNALYAECGDMPWPEPGFTVTQSNGRSCMPDAEYLARDLHQQAVERWGACMEIAVCRLRGGCK